MSATVDLPIRIHDGLSEERKGSIRQALQKYQKRVLEQNMRALEKLIEEVESTPPIVWPGTRCREDEAPRKRIENLWDHHGVWLDPPDPTVTTVRDFLSEDRRQSLIRTCRLDGITRLADVNADGNTDITTIDPHTCNVQAYTGNGDFTFSQNPVTIWSQGTPQGCADCSSIYFTDNNADGRADLICLTSDATAWLTYNLPAGDIHSLDNIDWQYFGWILINQNVTRNQARFCDLNGDGQDDVMTLNGVGDLHAYVSNTLAAFLGGRQEFTGDGTSFSRVMLFDIDGDGRADYLEVDPDTGAVSAFINQCADGGYPRKPGQPRPDSPGTSMSPVAAVAPTFTSAQPNPGPTTTTSSTSAGQSPQPTGASTFPGGKPIPFWASGSWTTIGCTSAGATTTTAGQLGGKPTDVPNGAVLWKQAMADDALTEMFDAYTIHYEDVIGQDPEAVFEYFVKSSWQSPQKPETCSDPGNAECMDIQACEDVGSPALFYISQSMDVLKSLHYSLYQAFRADSGDVEALAGNWVNTFVQDTTATDTALKRIQQLIEGFIAAGLAILFLVAAPEAEAAFFTTAIYTAIAPSTQFALNNAIASGVSNVGTSLEKYQISFSDTALEFVTLIHGIANTIADYETNELTNDFVAAGQTIGDGSQWKVQALIMDHTVYDCNSRDFSKAGKIPGDYDTAHNILNGIKGVDSDGPAIDGNAAWCDADNNAYFLWNAKYGFAHTPPETDPKSYHGPGVNLFPHADIQTLNPGNTAWGNVTLEGIVRSTVLQFIKAGYVNSYDRSTYHIDAFDFSGMPPPGFFPFPV
ncbi:hypothetical protein PRZ48_011041 [Zasmidium cellare]|uniref:Uncharacterized protein n=1 Tax=Zasmidium cellare TaxID=395010 RepID=A0ABR0EBF5_ZASCE|nr:hypothetical protein PRZ48_011041 [Zasmidium cellare]